MGHRMGRTIVGEKVEPGSVTSDPVLSDHEVLTGFAIMLYELHNQAKVREW